MTAYGSWVERMDIIYFYFNDISNTVSLNILLGDLMKYRLAKQTVKQIENCL